jgi:hypothetical protein
VLHKIIITNISFEPYRSNKNSLNTGLFFDGSCSRTRFEPWGGGKAIGDLEMMKREVEYLLLPV